MSSRAAADAAAECRAVCQEVDTAVEVAEAGRKPLVSQAMRGVVAVKQYNPRFEQDFALGRNYDPDKVRAEERKWKRRVSS